MFASSNMFISCGKKTWSYYARHDNFCNIQHREVRLIWQFLIIIFLFLAIARHFKIVDN